MLAVRAKDTAGQLSAVSTTVAFRTLPTVTTPPGGCKVTYSANCWGNGFTGERHPHQHGVDRVDVVDAGVHLPRRPAWSRRAGARRYSQTGSAVTVTNAAWNGTVPAGGSTSIGFNGSYSGTNSAPTGFTVNGAPCA